MKVINCAKCNEEYAIDLNKPEEWYCPYCDNLYSITTDELSVENLKKELDDCIQTLIEASAAANITQDIVVGNLVDRKLADLAKTHKLAVDYIEKVTGKNIDVVLAENAALETEEDE